MALFKKDSPFDPAAELRRALNFSWLRPGKLAGARQPGAWNPMETDLEILAAEGVQAILNLRERPYVLPGSWAGRFELVHVPMDDFSVPSVAQMEEMVELVQAFLSGGKPVVAHCMAGIGRTGVVLAALLMAREGLSAEQAIAELRPHGRGPQSDRQRYFLLTEWARALGRGGP